MQKTVLLACLTATLLIAGCLGGNADNNADDRPRVEVLEHEREIRDDTGDLFVSGAVRNNGDTEINYVDVWVTFYDSTGQELQSVVDSSSNVPPGDFFGFSATYSGNPADVATYDVSLEVYD